MSATDMRYTVGPVVYVRLEHKDNERGVLHKDGGLVADFLKFCMREGLVNVGGGTTGPGIHHGYYTTIYKTPCRNGKPVTTEMLYEMITEWLDDHGVTARQEW